MRRASFRLIPRGCGLQVEVAACLRFALAHSVRTCAAPLGRTEANRRREASSTRLIRTVTVSSENEGIGHDDASLISIVLVGGCNRGPNPKNRCRTS
jgi:hypothetical protein